MNYNKNNKKSLLAKSSVISHQQRGKGGNNSYRGNAGANFMQDVILFGAEHTKKSINDFFFVDANEGSATSRDVAKALGCQYVGLDLMNGEDFTANSILTELPKSADMVFTHPPYAEMIEYSGQQWGNKMLDNDLSNPNISKQEFLEKSQVMLMNQRDAVRDGGLYATLIGDMRKKGKFYSFQADYQMLMPKSELISVAIKMQHNCMSDGRSYGGSFVPIKHEYLLIWKKQANKLFSIGFEVAMDARAKIGMTWRSVIRIVMMKLQTAKLEDIYAEVEIVASKLIANNAHYKAKIRQILQKHYFNVERGVWGIAS